MGSTVVHPASHVRGHLTVPGDKSISHRYALLAALADGQSTITHYAPGADCASTLACLCALGVPIHHRDSVVTVEGRGLDGLLRPAAPLDAGNSGTTLRLLAGILAGHPFDSVITGDASLQRRPMQRIIAPLNQLGADVQGAEGHPPLTIRGSRLHGIEFTPSVASAQVKSAVLLAGLLATGETFVREPHATRDHTERALPQFGIDLIVREDMVGVRGGHRLHATDLTVPGDISSAAFWATAAAALPGSDITVTGVGLNPTRTAVLSILERVGARIEISDFTEVGGEPRGSIRVRSGDKVRLDLGANDVPDVIDELPVLAALATHGGELRVTGAGELRHKESDRIAALATGLTGLGADIEELDDGFHVRGARPITGGRADAAGDHRLAMAFAIAGLGATAPCEITDSGAVDVSYPGFFDVMTSLVG